MLWLFTETVYPMLAVGAIAAGVAALELVRHWPDIRRSMGLHPGED